MKITSLALTFAVSVFALPALAASTLTCEVERYSKSTGAYQSCGEFRFNLPQDNSYGYGKGDCAGLVLYTSYFRENGIESYALSIFADQDDDTAGALVSRYDEAFPSKFVLQILSRQGLDHRVSCATR